MKIQGPIEFVAFISVNALEGKDSLFTQLVNCVANFRAACNCYKKEDKLKMWRTCNGLYNNSVTHVVPKLKDAFLSKTQERQISFYSEHGDLLRIISR